MIDINDIPLKTRLASAGYEVRRVEIDGIFRGVQIWKDEEMAHKTHYGSFELGIELCEAAGT